MSAQRKAQPAQTLLDELVTDEHHRPHRRNRSPAAMPLEHGGGTGDLEGLIGAYRATVNAQRSLPADAEVPRAIYDAQIKAARAVLAKWATQPHPVPSDLDSAIDAVCLGHRLYGVALTFDDSVILGREPTEAEDRLHAVGEAAFDAAVSALLEAPVKSATDLERLARRLERDVPTGVLTDGQLAELFFLKVPEAAQAERALAQAVVDAIPAPEAPPSDDEDFNAVTTNKHLATLGCRVTRAGVVFVGKPSSEAIEILNDLSDGEMFSLACQSDRTKWLIVPQERIDASDDPAWAAVMQSFRDADDRWDEASDASDMSDADELLLSSDEIAALEAAEHSAGKARSEAEAALLRYPVRTARSLADKLGIYYALHHQWRLEDIWLDAALIAGGILADEFTDGEEQAFHARFFLDAERLAAQS